MWRKRLRLAVAVIGLGVAAAVLFALRPRETRAPVIPIERVDPAATVETRGCDIVQLKGSTQDLRVECESQATYEDGRTRLVGVRLTVDNRAGRSFVVTGNEAGVGANQSAFEMKGDVRLEASDGLVATSREASYADAEGIVRAPGPVQFARGRMTGTGIGFTFDQQRDTAWLLDRAVVKFAADPASGTGPMEVTSGTAGFARTDRYMRFERGVRMTREGQVIEADEAMVHLFPDRDEPDRIELRGQARITGGEGMGALRVMQARDINLDYGEDGRTLEQATLSGQSAVELAGTGGAPGQQLSSEWIAVEMGSDGAITSLAGRDNVVLTLPAAADAPARAIRAQQLTGSGAAGQGLSAMRFEERVEFREAGARGAAGRVARSQRLDAELSPQDGTFQVARFTGSVRFEDGSFRAQSGEAIYRVVDGGLDLRGKDGNAVPFVSDDTMRIDGDSIDVTLSPRQMAAKGTVRSVLQPSAAKAGAATPQARRPGLLGDNDPVNVIADTLTYDEAARKGVYTGKARLWQGDTVVQADTITLDETSGDLSAKGNVVTTLPLAPEAGETPAQPAPAKGKATTAGPTILRAGTFVYRDEARRAVYDSKAQMNGEQGDLRAEHIELLLKPGENALDRLEARGAVQVLLDNRQASGASLVYRPESERYEITGAPGRFIDECNESAGRTLTFFRSSDRLIIDGNEEVRTETRGGKCPGRPPL